MAWEIARSSEIWKIAKGSEQAWILHTDGEQAILPNSPADECGEETDCNTACYVLPVPDSLRIFDE
jgi:hypothetical protein